MGSGGWPGPQAPPCLLLSEPICAVGHGVAALCSATNEDGSWVFQGYSVTGVSAAQGSQAVVGFQSIGMGWDPWGAHGHLWHWWQSLAQMGIEKFGTRLAVICAVCCPFLGGLPCWESLKAAIQAVGENGPCT